MMMVTSSTESSIDDVNTNLKNNDSFGTSSSVRSRGQHALYYSKRNIVWLGILLVAIECCHGFCSPSRSITRIIETPTSSVVSLPTRRISTHRLYVVETEAPSSITEDSTNHNKNLLSTQFPTVIHTTTNNNDNIEHETAIVEEGSQLLPGFTYNMQPLSPTSELLENYNISSELDEENVSPSSDQTQSEKSSEQGQHNDQEVTARADDDDDTDEEKEKTKRVDQTAKAAMLLSKKQSTSRKATTTTNQKSTSVGTRRVGSATKARGNTRSMTRLVDAVRTGTSVSSGNSPQKTTKKTTDDTPDEEKSSSTKNIMRSSTSFPGPSACRAMIEATVDDMLKNTKPTMGLLGEVIQHAPLIMYRPKPGTVLAKSKRSSVDSAVTVRVASPKDDVDIAQLRLSVFSDFTPETRKIFCDRSCHLLSTRRHRGAMCIVATESEKSSPFMTPITEKNRIIGTAEISFHEFSETKLGRSRPKDSILYVTEVAVNSKHRRKGIANLMMEAVDKVAKIRKTETIYLHVDVENVAALRLYNRSGYRKLPNDNPVFLEFTTKLNLHDGATKGRRHFLMAKDMKEPTWIEDKYKDESLNIQTQRGTLGIEVLQ